MSRLGGTRSYLDNRDPRLWRDLLNQFEFIIMNILISSKGKIILTPFHALVKRSRKAIIYYRMTFEEKVRLLRSLPQFKVVPISEVKAIAFVAKESGGKLYLDPEDIEKIVREYPDLASKLGRAT